MIVIGILVKLIKVVKIIEFNGVILIIGIIVFKIVFIIYGLLFIVFKIVFLIIFRIFNIMGWIKLVINEVVIGMIKIMINKLIFFGICFCICLIIKDKRYVVIKVGNKLILINDRFKIIEKIGLILKVSGIRVLVVKLFRLFIVLLICDI